ncbi:MAG: SIS domain-containing protein [Candidatus Glassbacteria bacterium]|nr:SIS domain-containing protein [Candidatus Glassbacteria bacterium]
MTTKFLAEVSGQPQALRDLVAFYRKDGRRLLRLWQDLLDRHPALVFCGMGTSEHSALLVQDALVKQDKTVSVHDAGEYLHYLLYPRRASAGLFVLISQSGESAETRKVTLTLQGKAPTVVLANDESSTMARAADLFLPLKAGEEASVTNKTYLNTLALLYLMAGGKPAALEGIAGCLAASVQEEQVEAAAEFLMPAESIHFIARGPALAAARQLALTFMEGARVHATAFAAGAFRHGPFEVVRQGHRAVFLVPAGKTDKLCFGILKEMLALGSRVLLLTDCENPPQDRNLYTIRFKPPGEERLFPLAITQVQGCLLHHVARLRGYEAGVFRTVSKVTAVE